MVWQQGWPLQEAKWDAAAGEGRKAGGRETWAPTCCGRCCCWGMRPAAALASLWLCRQPALPRPCLPAAVLPPCPGPAPRCPPAPQFGHLVVNTSMLESAQQAEQELEASMNAKQSQLANSRWAAAASRGSPRAASTLGRGWGGAGGCCSRVELGRAWILPLGALAGSPGGFAAGAQAGRTQRRPGPAVGGPPAGMPASSSSSFPSFPIRREQCIHDMRVPSEAAAVMSPPPPPITPALLAGLRLRRGP